MTFCWFFSEARSKLLASLAEFSIFGSERPADYRGRMFSVFAVLPPRQRDFGLGYRSNVPATFCFGVFDGRRREGFSRTAVDYR